MPLNYDVFINRYLLLFIKHFPLQTFKASKRLSPRQEWMTKGLVKCSNKKSTLYKKFLKSKAVIDKEKYVCYRNKLKIILKIAKQKFYEKKFQLVSGNLYKTWQLLNSVMNKDYTTKLVSNFCKDGIILNSPDDIVECFNDYFVNVGPKLANVIPTTAKQFSSYLSNSPMNSLSLFLTDSHEVINVVNCLNNKTSYGVDDIPVIIVKKCISAIANPMAALINCSFRTGRFPDSLKIAKICPIFKSGCENEFSNYRPISILPSFSKIYEKIAYNRLENFVLSNETLTNCQYGFRSKHSTFMALLDMYNKVSESIDLGNFTIGIFIDLSKAFDTIDHGILCHKLEHYGVRGIALEWFRDYLNSRKQCVSFNNVFSGFKEITCGVPQGSILGPLLFILYVNDITNCSKLLKFILFADDTNLFYSHKNMEDFIATTNQELGHLSDWFKANKLSLNAGKTNFMLFGRKGQSVKNELYITIDGNKIERVDHVKFLGVHIDACLNWKQHTSHVSAKISKSIGIINKIKCILSNNLLKTLYYSLIYPYLVYCNILWGNACHVSLSKLITLQKRAIRIITRSKYLAPSKELFKSLNILNLADINKFQIGQFVYKSLNNLLPRSSSYHVNRYLCDHRYPLRNDLTTKSVAFKCRIRETYIGVSGPKLWNALPLSVVSSLTFLIFKNNFKIFLLDKY